MIRLAFAAALLAAASPSVAQPSGRWGSVDVGAGTYRPNIDAEFSTSPGPLEDAFGTGRGWMFQLGVSRALFTRVGSLEVGFRTGYYQDKGHGQQAAAGGGFEDSIDETELKIVPTSLSLLYRFDWPVERYGIPGAPYARLTFERYNWWINDGNGDQAMKGATMGWSATAGLAFLLDILDRKSARDLDRETGVNHTYLFFEVTKSSIDDFGSSSSWDMSGEDLSLAGGLTFVF